MHDLTSEETRVLGSLLEKEVLTPDVYPMTLNGLLNACNQKSSREPVVSYDEATVQRALDGLREKGLVRLATGAESRVTKYRQLLSEMYNFTPRETAALTVLFLRGPQTAGEIRTRSGRLYEFGEPTEVEATLLALAEREFVVKLARQPGSRESRYAHRFGAGEPETPMAEGVEPAQPRVDRTAALEARVEFLEAEVTALRDELAKFRKQFE